MVPFNPLLQSIQSIDGAIFTVRFTVQFTVPDYASKGLTQKRVETLTRESVLRRRGCSAPCGGTGFQNHD